LEFLQAVAASDPSKPSDPANPSPVEKFLGSHPAALAFVQAPKPAPSSFARETYFGVVAYRFTNTEGATRFGRYRIVPAAGNEHLDAKATAAKSANYRSTSCSSGSPKVQSSFGLLRNWPRPGTSSATRPSTGRRIDRCSNWGQLRSRSLSRTTPPNKSKSSLTRFRASMGLKRRSIHFWTCGPRSI